AAGEQHRGAQQRLAPLGQERLQAGDGRVVVHVTSSLLVRGGDPASRASLSSTKYEAAGRKVDGGSRAQGWVHGTADLHRTTAGSGLRPAAGRGPGHRGPGL